MSAFPFKHIRPADWDQRLALVILATGYLQRCGHLIAHVELDVCATESRIIIGLNPFGEQFENTQTVTAPDPDNNHAPATFIQVKRFGCLIQWRAD